ncbi:MAG: 4-hydroxyphenylpyruvate dioxygenase [Nostoc sp. DedQUE11]|nr:4-hydroxyphenylpyruvate dioxygenase [Nostoc sp. DedQUE11]
MSYIQAQNPLSQGNNLLKIQGIDYLEFYVGNATQAAYFYRTAFGFTPIAYAGLETGMCDRLSFLLKQGNIYIVLTGATKPNSEIAKHVALHGDSVKDIAFVVDDATYAFEEMLKRGASPILEPTVFESDEGQVIKATIATCGNTVHSLIQRKHSKDKFLPKYQKTLNPPRSCSIGITELDHVTIVVEEGQLNSLVNFYSQVLGLHESYKMSIVTKSGMNLAVMENRKEVINLTLVEPVSTTFKSPLEEYLEFNCGSGVHHIAFLSDNIVSTVRCLQASGIDVAYTPDTYYELLENSTGHICEDLAALRELKILVDWNSEGYLLQTFTKPMQDRPTFFLEIIQRRNNRGFGEGNIKALLEAIEREQVKRGNL